MKGTQGKAFRESVYPIDIFLLVRLHHRNKRITGPRLQNFLKFLHSANGRTGSLGNKFLFGASVFALLQL